MTTTHLPSILQAHTFTPFDPLKTEKFLNDDHEYEISKWLKLENEPLPGLGGSNYISNDLVSTSFYSSGSSVPLSTSSQLPTLQPEFSNNYTSAAFSFSLPSNSSSSQVTQLPTHLPTASTQPQYSAQHYAYPYPPQYSNQYQTVQFTTSQPQYASAPTQYSTPQYSSSQGGFSSQFAPSYTSSHYVSSPSYPSSQYTNAYPNTQFIQQPQYTSSTPQYSQGVVPTQLFQPQYTTNPTSTNGNYQPVPQFQYLFSQYHQLIPKNQTEELVEDKKRKQVRPFVRRVRQTRPKVVEAKGAVQCKGRNRKKGTQCRNAALMEYIGPRPIYCAEHIELDPKSLYEKCKSSYQKEPGDNKGCKEVVLKEFGVCYKHYPDLILELIENHEYEKTRRHSERITDLLAQLERDAAVAKKKDGDLYQRKNKLIPKFQEMKKLIMRALETLDSCRHKDLPEVLPTELSQLSSPIVLDGMSAHIVEGLSSEDDDSLLSSPQSDSSLEDEFEQILN
jgi:hypothetical protein